MSSRHHAFRVTERGQLGLTPPQDSLKPYNRQIERGHRAGFPTGEPGGTGLAALDSQLDCATHLPSQTLEIFHATQLHRDYPGIRDDWIR